MRVGGQAARRSCLPDPAAATVDSRRGSLVWCGGVNIRGGDYREHFGWGDANVNVPPTNCPFSYFVDICLMFASQIQLKIIIFCVLMVNLN